MFPSTKIVAVDDEREQLDIIVGSLRALGLGCIAYAYPDDIPEIDPSFSGVRALFLDIRLVGGTSPGQALNAPVSLLSRLIGENNGPYTLITWSSTDLHDQLIARINQTPSLKNRRPFESCALSKADLAGDPPRLEAEVRRLFTTNAPFGSLLDWESRVVRAGEAVLERLQGLSVQFAGPNPQEQMDELLSRLAVAGFGDAHAEQHKFEAVNETLLPMLGDALHGEFLSADPSQLWDDAVTKCGALGNLAPAIAAELNTKILFESGHEIPPHRRGAVLEVPDRWLPDKQFRRQFGATAAEVCGKLPAGLQPKWVLVQIQASCDFAQPKAAPIPYLLATTVPSRTSQKAVPGFVSLTPVFAPIDGLSEANFKLAVFRNIPHPLGKTTLKRGRFRVVGRLRDQLVDSLIHEHHSHGARPGFVSFS